MSDTQFIKLVWHFGGLALAAVGAWHLGGWSGVAIVLGFWAVVGTLFDLLYAALRP